MYESLKPVKEHLEHCKRILENRLYEGDDPIGEAEFNKLKEINVAVSNTLEML